MITPEILKQWMLEDNGSILYDPLHPGVFTGYVTITPERGQLMLQINTKNRDINKRDLAILKDSLAKGFWNDNVSTININEHNVLDDGQHRLLSVVQTGISIRCKVTYGVTGGTQHFTDRRGNRTLSDDLSIDGFRNSTKLAAITRILYLRNEKKYPVKIILNKGWASAVPDIVLYNYFLSISEEIEFLNKLLSTTYVSLRGLDINRDLVNVLGIEFHKANADDAKCFWKKLRDGVYDNENDPVKLLRERLVKSQMSNTNKIPKEIKAALIIKAWNFFEQGVTIKNLKYTSGGANPEPFPEIYNPYTDN